MTREDLIALHKKISDDSRELMMKKNNDYASPKGRDDLYAIFTNFLLGEHLRPRCKTEDGIFFRWTDKVCRYSNATDLEFELEVKEESRLNSLWDLINYSILLYAYLKVNLI